MNKAPVMFIGHGSPMNIISNNDFTDALKTVGKKIQKPAAILVVSAHWLTKGTYVTVNQSPSQIYDFYGFPDELYNVIYTPKGSPEIAQQICDISKGVIKLSSDWGLDHASWAVLYYIYPEADIPVLELSLDIHLSVEEHALIGAMLSSMRDNNVLIIGSGNIVHNLYEIDPRMDGEPYQWAVEFDKSIKEIIDKREFDKLSHYETIQYARKAAPTIDHYLPLVYFTSLVNENDEISYIFEGIQNGSVSMRSIIAM
jgi:4,5-DOPA dioxygenase extradiol